LQAFAVDSIDEDDSILIKVDSLDTGSYFEIDVPEVSPGYRRAAFDCGVLIRPCPPDHPSLLKSKHSCPVDEKLLLFSVTLQADGRVAGVPLSIINFITRNVIGAQWAMLLQISEDVKNGKRIDHKNAIEAKRELYGWLEERVRIMIDKIDAVASE
jgi:hypothetical protein